MVILTKIIIVVAIEFKTNAFQIFVLLKFLINGILFYISEKVFKQLRVKDAAVWLPPDSTSIDNRTLLSFVLEQSWSRSVAVFSSSFAHVNKGALFALYPDNLKLGLSLGEVALEELNGGTKLDKMVPVEDLKTAFNKRTAEHLGVRLSSSELRSYDAVFPSE